MMRVHLLKTLRNLLRVAIYGFRKKVKFIITSDKVLCNTVANVDVNPDENCFQRIWLAICVVQTTVKFRVQRTRRHVDKVPFKVSIDELRWVVALQAFDEAFRQVWVVFGLNPD
jgi:hypothetical protein